MITPIGNDLAANEVALRAGKCGVGRVPDFVEHKLSCEVGGLVQGPLETELIDRKKLRFCPPVGVMSVIAAQEAFAEAGLPLATRLLQIENDMTALIAQLQPDEIAIEELFFSKNITTGIAVAHGRGVILCTAEKLGVPICEYTPMQVKQAVVGYGLAEKKQVMDMTRRLLHLKTVPKPDDAADALAIAICHARSATSLLRHKDPNVKETV